MERRTAGDPFDFPGSRRILRCMRNLSRNVAEWALLRPESLVKLHVRLNAHLPLALPLCNFRPSLEGKAVDFFYSYV